MSRLYRTMDKPYIDIYATYTYMSEDLVAGSGSSCHWELAPADEQLCELD
jgi:hypothetical protein